MFSQVRYNDLSYYERLTDPNGPAMTHAMFAIGWLEAGEKKKADRAFMKNYANIRGPFKVLRCLLVSNLCRPNGYKENTHELAIVFAWLVNF